MSEKYCFMEMPEKDRIESLKIKISSLFYLYFNGLKYVAKICIVPTELLHYSIEPWARTIL